MDIMHALPILVLALVQSAALGPSLTTTQIVITVENGPRATHRIRTCVKGSV